MLHHHALDDELDEEERATSESNDRLSSFRSHEEDLPSNMFDEEEDDDDTEDTGFSRRDATQYAESGVLLTIHSIDEGRVCSRPMYAELVVATLRRMMNASGCITWIDLTEDSGAAAVARAASRNYSKHGLHPVALRALARTTLCVSYSPQVQRLGHGWTLWTAMLPSCNTEKRVTFVAACSDHLILTRIRVGDDDSLPVGGWWKSRRPSFNNKAHPKTIVKKKDKPNTTSCCLFCNRQDSSVSLNESYNQSVEALLSERKEDDSEQRVERRRKRITSEETQNSAGPTFPNFDGEGIQVDEAPSLHYLRRLMRDEDERDRAVRLGGAYMCAKIIAKTLSLARAALEFDDTISQLTHVCTDEKPGWRNQRVRFNRTVGMLLEAGKARAQIARLREYYEQTHQLVRSAVQIYSSSERLPSRKSSRHFEEAHLSDDDHENGRQSSLDGPMLRASQQSIMSHSSVIANNKKVTQKTNKQSAIDLVPWIRDLLNTAHADTRRLHQQDNLLHSYIVLARLRHEDDYQRVNVLLSLIATIFLPLTFLSGVWGMNFDHLPLHSQRWAFSSFLLLSACIVAFAVLLFWYRGWLNVAKPATSKGSSLQSEDQNKLPLYQPPSRPSDLRRQQSAPFIAIV